MDRTVVRIDDLSKRYRVGSAIYSYGRLTEALWDAVRSPFRPARSREQKRENQWTWALRNVSLEVQEGEVLGIVGANGAGKTTLLKILSRVTDPTEGSAVLHGRVASLLEAGTGFHPELTGRENVFLSGAILGMRRAETARKFDEIVAFAGVERYIDTPVKRFSSGMYIRLAFAVAAHLDSDILLVDEILAMGDAEFQRKCLGVMDQAARGGRTALFVTHNLGAINRLCHRAVWLHRGRVQASGDTASIVGEYLRSADAAVAERVWPAEDRPSASGVVIHKAVLTNATGEAATIIEAARPFRLSIEHQVERPLEGLEVGFRLFASDGTLVFTTGDADALSEGPDPRSTKPGRYTSTCEIPGHLLNVGRYTTTLIIHLGRTRTPLIVENALSFEVVQRRTIDALETRRPGVTAPVLQWRLQDSSVQQEAIP